MFASLGFLAERFQNRPLRIVVDSISEHVRGGVYGEGPVRVTLKGVIRHHKTLKTIVDATQDGSAFDFSIKGLPSSLVLPDIDLSYTITATSALSESTIPIWIRDSSTQAVDVISQQLACRMPGTRRISPLCVREGLSLRIATSCSALVISEDATTRLTLVITCDEDDHPGTIHADVEWHLRSKTTIGDEVIYSSIPGHRRQVRWSRWVSKASWASEASLWVTLPRDVTPTFETSEISHTYVLAVQLRLSTLAEQPKLSRIFNIEPEALVFELPVSVVLCAGGSMGDENRSGYNSV